MSDFFSKLKDEFNKGINTIAVKSGTLTEITKLKANISSLESSKKKLLEDLGNKTYELIDNKTLVNDELYEIFKSINELNDSINLKNEEIEKIKEDEKEKLAQQKVEPINMYTEEEINEVPKCDCGAIITPGSMFCSSCGKKLN